MNEQFLNKLLNKDYISLHLYNYIKLNNFSIIPNNFNIDTYNKEVIEKYKDKYKEYFNRMYNSVDKNIILDDEQIEAILSDEKYSLILAGAGTGKTTTITSKIKYLIDIKGVDPSKILVLSYTKKATEELIDRLIYDFNLPVDISTFHSLGYKIIRNLYKDNHPYVVDYNKEKEIFIDYFKDKFSNKDSIKELIDTFNESDIKGKWVFSKNFKENYAKYSTFDDYFNFYKEKKINEAINSEGGIKRKVDDIIEKKLLSDRVTTIKGEVVKSKGEALIANYLFINNIDYSYEKVYDDIVPNYKVYRPDFTIDYGGETIYIEYFGLSNYKTKLATYQKIKEIKEKFHYDNHNKFIKIDYYPQEDIIDSLKKGLDKYNIKLTKKSDREIYETLLDYNKTAEIYPLKDLFYSVIKNIKASIYRDEFYKVVNTKLSKYKEDEYNIRLHQYKLIFEFYRYYQKRLYNSDNYGFDFADMIYYATINIDYVNNNILNYNYIFIDEYQDISIKRYDLTYKILLKDNASIIAVGDDWQSIFSFSGSKIKYIYNFNNYFKDSKIFKISTTYRNSQKLVDYAGDFIMKNKDQIVKDLVSYRDDINKPIRFIGYSNIDNEYNIVKDLIIKIKELFNHDRILLLARYNKSIDRLLNTKLFIPEIDNKIKISDTNIEVDIMTIHKAKGLTYDHVILIDFDNTFPKEELSSDFWINELFKERLDDESLEYAEERRIFYVALTRAKKYVFIMSPIIRSDQSKFLKEISIITKG